MKYADSLPTVPCWARPGLGWHYEAGIQFVRLMLAGVFDEYPDLQIILGHWGEVVLFYSGTAELSRTCDQAAKTRRRLLPAEPVRDPKWDVEPSPTCNVAWRSWDPSA